MTTYRANNATPPVFLGTAGWGQDIPKPEAYRILEIFYANGHRWVDTATNYPINKNPEDFGKTILWLCDFRKDFPEICVYAKIGAANNLGESTQLINISYFEVIFERLTFLLSGNLKGLGVHWDNSEKGTDRSSVVEFFSRLHKRNFKVGISGISAPENYLLNESTSQLPWMFQVNFSPLNYANSILKINQIKALFPNAEVYAYGLLGGRVTQGLPKGGNRMPYLTSTLGAPRMGDKTEMLDFLIMRCFSNKIDGILIGPNTRTQCLEWCEVFQRLNFR